MSNPINNLEKLTDQIFNEGVEKAEKQANKILQEAEQEKSLILSKAKGEAADIVKEAQREAQQLKTSVEGELELKAKQFLSDLKAKIEDLLVEKIVVDNTSEALADVKFMQSAIKDIIKQWKETDDIELILPKALEDKIETAFSRSIQDNAANLQINFDDGLTGGFRIAKQKDHYQISFSDDDFIQTFRSYLTKQANTVLFKAPTEWTITIS